MEDTHKIMAIKDLIFRLWQFCR